MVSTTTLYKWHHSFKWPEIFFKINRRLLIDVEEWNKHIEAIKAKRDKEIDKLKKRGIIE